MQLQQIHKVVTKAVPLKLLVWVLGVSCISCKSSNVCMEKSGETFVGMEMQDVQESVRKSGGLLLFPGVRIPPGWPEELVICYSDPVSNYDTVLWSAFQDGAGLVPFYSFTMKSLEDAQRTLGFIYSKKPDKEGGWLYVPESMMKFDNDGVCVSSDAEFCNAVERQPAYDLKSIDLEVFYSLVRTSAVPCK